MRVLVVSADRGFVEGLRSAGVEAEQLQHGQALSGKVPGDARTVLVDLRTERALDVVAALSAAGLAVVAVADGSDPVVVRDAWRAGAADVAFLARPAEIVELVRSASARPAGVRGMASRGEVIALVSSQGGVGRTTVALSLAVLLSEQGRTILADLVPSGVVHVLCGVHPERTVLDAVSRGGTPEAVASCLVEWEGIGLLCSGVSRGAWPVDDQDAERLVSSMAELARYAVVDLERAPERYCPAVLERSSLVLAMCRMTVPGLRNMKLYIQEMTRQHVPLQKVMVVGVAGRWGISAQDAEELTGLRVDAVLPHDQVAVWAENEGVPVVLGAPRSGLARALRSLADEVLERLRAPAQETAAQLAV